MNILVQLSHPAHFHLYKNAIKNWQADGHQVFVLIKTKDMLEDLLRNAGIEYHNILPVAHRSSKIGILWDMVVRDWRMTRFAIKHHIDILTGSTPEVGHVAWLLRRKAVTTTEDDSAVVPAFAKVAAPFLQCLITPSTCNNGRMEPKSVKYPGYHELAYLHPNHFTPDPEVVRSYGIPVPSFPSQLSPFYSDSESQLVPQVPNKSSINAQKEQAKPYIILRFASLNAHHDSGIKGINTEIAQRLIDILKPHGRIYITSERPLEPQFEQYRIKINPLDMHHVMAFASLYIGDSQTMAAEAGVLGVPFVRFNDFVGRIGYLRELEDTYHLGFGIKASAPGSVDQLCKRVEEIVEMKAAERQATFQERRERMLAEKIDCAKFLTYFIEGYPATVKEVRGADKSFWERFM